MQSLLKILYLVFYFKLPWFIVKRLILRDKIKTLEIIAKKGHYKNRIQLTQNIDHLSIKNQWKLLIILLDDNLEKVSEDIIKRYENKYLPTDLKSALFDKRKYWKEKHKSNLKKQARMAELFKNNTNYKRKFGNGESLKNVKDMLKKPMNNGKWF